MTAPRISVILPVLAPTPFLRAMTEFCIKTLRTHASQPFELVVVEAVYDHFSPEKKLVVSGEDPDTLLMIDKHLHFPEKIGQVKELNAGIRAASGEFIVFTGNDLVAPPNWDGELLLPFERYQDCGISSLAAGEPGWWIGPRDGPRDRIVEGMYSPFCCFRKRQLLPSYTGAPRYEQEWLYDEGYGRVYQDSDLVMRMYEAGLRAYRSCRAVALHLNAVTNTSVDPAEHNAQLAKDEALFYQRWESNPKMMFAMIRSGTYVYGREHESWEAKIHRHL